MPKQYIDLFDYYPSDKQSTQSSDLSMEFWTFHNFHTEHHAIFRIRVVFKLVKVIVYIAVDRQYFRIHAP